VKPLPIRLLFQQVVTKKSC